MPRKRLDSQWTQNDDGSISPHDGEPLNVENGRIKSQPASYHVHTDGSTIYAEPQADGLGYYEGDDIGPVLYHLIVNELPPVGSEKEAAGRIELKKGTYPGDLSNATGGGVPLPSSCWVVGEAVTHRSDNQTSISLPQTEPLVELEYSGVGFRQPDTDDDLACYCALKRLMLRGPGPSVAGSLALDGNSGSNRWDWFFLNEVAIFDTETAWDFRNCHYTFVDRCQALNFTAVESGPDKHLVHKSAFYSKVVGSEITLRGNSAISTTRYVDTIFVNESDANTAQVIADGRNIELRGCEFSNSAPSAGTGSAFLAKSSSGNVRLINNVIRSTAEYEATIYWVPDGPDSEKDLLAFNYDFSNSPSSATVASTDTQMWGNHLPNGVNYIGQRTRVNGSILMAGAPTASNYDTDDAGTHIYDTSTSPPGHYVVGKDGSVLGPI